MLPIPFSFLFSYQLFSWIWISYIPTPPPFSFPFSADLDSCVTTSAPSTINHIIAIAVGCAVGAIVVIIALVFVCQRGSRKKEYELIS
jgi:ABC-type Na+ efflux pump permease subunit